MELNSKLTKQIEETAYLSVENSFRYRPIMRLFYEHHELGENYLLKEDVYNELKDAIPNYTIDDCLRDLEYLVEKMSLNAIQDTENVTTLEKFRFKNYRYEMTDYAITIERMTIELEEMEVKLSSLEPRLFERIKLHIDKMSNIENLSIDLIHQEWTDLMNDFSNLNHNYQDFIKQFQNPKTEELLKVETFLDFKDNFVKYINNFTKEYLYYSLSIQDSIKKIDEDKINILLDELVTYQKSIPTNRDNYDYVKYRETALKKFLNIKKWFYNPQGKSEGERLLDASNNIIAKITKYASSLVELHGNMLRRKEEYSYLCRLFDSLTDISDAHLLAGTSLGVFTVRHFKGESNLDTDTIVPSYAVEENRMLVETMKKRLRKENFREPIIDKTFAKQQVLATYQKEEQHQKELLKDFVLKKDIYLKGEIELNNEERQFIFRLLDNFNDNNKLYDPVFGKEYSIKFLKNEKCTIISEDGIFSMPIGLEIHFGGIYE